MQVTLKSSSQQAQPGDDVQLLINAPTGSFVGQLAIDQSVQLLKSGNDLDQSIITNEWYKYDSHSFFSGSDRNEQDFSVINGLAYIPEYFLNNVLLLLDCGCGAVIKF